MPKGKANAKTANKRSSTSARKTSGGTGSGGTSGMSKGGGTAGRRTNLAAINKQFRELPQQQQHKFLITSLGSVLTSTGGNKSSAGMS